MAQASCPAIDQDEKRSMCVLCVSAVLRRPGKHRDRRGGYLRTGRGSGSITQRHPARGLLRKRIADCGLQVDGEFVACGAPVGAQSRALGGERPCRWPCRAVGGGASGVDVAAGPRSASQLGRGNRALQSPASAAAIRCRRGQSRQASPLCGWSRRRHRPVATAASPCRPRLRA